MSRDEYLMHYGVKGMKWGVRKDAERSGQRREKRSETISQVRNYTGSRSSNALKKARRRDINKMSNQELQETITRLNLERQYRSLTKVDLMRGQKAASDYLKYENSYKAIKKSASYELGKKVVSSAVTSIPVDGALLALSKRG